MTLGKYSSLVLRNYYLNVIGMLPCSQDGEYKLRNCAEKNFSCSHLFHKVIHRITRLIHIYPIVMHNLKKFLAPSPKKYTPFVLKKKNPFFWSATQNPRMDFYGILRRKTRTRLVEMPPEQALTKIQ